MYAAEKYIRRFCVIGDSEKMPNSNGHQLGSGPGGICLMHWLYGMLPSLFGLDNGQWSDNGQEMELKMGKIYRFLGLMGIFRPWNGKSDHIHNFISYTRAVVKSTRMLNINIQSFSFLHFLFTVSPQNHILL